MLLLSKILLVRVMQAFLELFPAWTIHRHIYDRFDALFFKSLSACLPVQLPQLTMFYQSILAHRNFVYSENLREWRKKRLIHTVLIKSLQIQDYRFEDGAHFVRKIEHEGVAQEEVLCSTLLVEVPLWQKHWWVTCNTKRVEYKNFRPASSEGLAT